MKWLIIVIICGGLAWLYLNNQEKISKMFGKAKGEEVAKKEESKPTAPGKTEEPKPEKEDPKPKVGKREGKGPEVTPEIAERFPLPEFKTLEELVGNWQKVPPSAFPRTVMLKKAVEIIVAGGAGRTTLQAGSKAVALSLEGGQLTVGRSKTATATGKIGIDDTDFKQVLSDIYEGWKKRKLRQVYAKRANAMREHAASSRVAASGGGGSDEYKKYLPVIGERPEQLGNGQVPVMVTSLYQKDVNEIKLDEIERWGKVRFEIVEGEPYWTATVNYQTATLFGLIDTEAQALIRKGRVLDWVYTGSGEEVP